MSQTRLIEVETSILAKNDGFAASNRRLLELAKALEGDTAGHGAA